MTTPERDYVERCGMAGGVRDGKPCMRKTALSAINGLCRFHDPLRTAPAVVKRRLGHPAEDRKVGAA